MQTISRHLLFATSYLLLWDMLSLRLVSKQTFVVVGKYSRFKKYLLFQNKLYQLVCGIIL